MFNQRGQAFSVFELMIAAIVAIAILFVLLPILSGIGGGGGVNAAKSAISNSLANVEQGGSITSQSFTLTNGLLITSKMFSGYDQHSILFQVDPKLGLTNFDFGPKGSGADDPAAYSTFYYKAATAITAEAYVICETTGPSLESTLTDSGLDSQLQNKPTELCGTTGDFQPCCVVLIKRSTK